MRGARQTGAVNVTRRSLLSFLPALAASTMWAPTAAARSVVNVRDYGAAGDGKTDDSAAIEKAVRALSSGSTLYFPAGSYRFAHQNPAGSAAVALTGLSDVNINFDLGAELVMDNLDSETGLGTGHGIFIRGPASGIALHNVRIRWTSRPPRSFGDGIRILGCPVDTGTPPLGWTGPAAPISNVTIANCQVRSSPQAGVILAGVSDISVRNLEVHDTAADGLHFNACRRARVSGHTVTDNGDDGLALVTYYSEQPSFDSAAQTFAFPTLTDWSNTDFTIADVSVSGGRANGVRLAGAHGVVLRAVTVTGKGGGAGIVADSAATISPLSQWRYVASRGIRLDDITVTDCEMGIQLLARPASNTDGRFSDFDLAVSGVKIRDCSNWAVRAESLSGQPVTGLQLADCTVTADSETGGNGGIGLGNARNVSLGTISITHSRPVIAFTTSNTQNLSIDSLRLTVTEAQQPSRAPIPCALFDYSTGSIHHLDVNWPQAPTSWTPVQVNSRTSPGGALHVQPVSIHTLSVQPASVAKTLGTS